MATNNSSKRLATMFRCGNIKATIWQNVSEKVPFFVTTFSRLFKDQSGAWRNGSSFGPDDLNALMNVAFEAKEWMTARTLKCCSARTRYICDSHRCEGGACYCKGAGLSGSHIGLIRGQQMAVDSVGGGKHCGVIHLGLILQVMNIIGSPFNCPR